jgi:hypothetical protein
MCRYPKEEKWPTEERGMSNGRWLTTKCHCLMKEWAGELMNK